MTPRRTGTATRTATQRTAADTPSATETKEPTDTPTEAGGTPSAVAEMESELANVGFDGEYFDTHAHWQRLDSAVVSAYASTMQEHDIGATVLFSPSQAAASDYEAFLGALTDPDVEYLPFMSAPPPGRNLPKSLGSLYEGKEQAFWGIGEWKPQGTPRDFDGSQLSALWQLAADIDVPVMYHPFPEQEGQVESALADNPDTTFLLHGHQMLGYGQERPGLGPTLPRLLEEYDNLYWTLDFATMTSGSLVRFQGSREFHEWYDANADRMIDLFGAILANLLKAGPSQVVWGTDVAWEWNTNDDVFSRVMEFTERVVASVPSRHRAAYKRENALELFGLSA